ncbi:5-carboxymethyl-2-hydroxymuconate Delta-isomerase [Falsirhodobacter halotolerans]|uniref:5-carboxymethyl-2-hydroxymuconate Delta-isomerase n=1 Tax=Falsirhodobacter halotolerans TaxID=1146892 RepID=UPI001FD5C627|nr:hypothetical protein [Falsirhodobacter halotolerans]MCJ8140110.1 hypothetical protein [Falsirhodobacter halotolerans]
MPHVIIEYSGNIAEWGDPATITGAVHAALCALEDLPVEAIKTRSAIREDYRIGRDIEGFRGFVVILFRTRPGREDHVLLNISETARGAVLAHVAPVEGKTLSVSVETQMMDPVAVVHAKV